MLELSGLAYRKNEQNFRYMKSSLSIAVIRRCGYNKNRCRSLTFLLLFRKLIKITLSLTFTDPWCFPMAPSWNLILNWTTHGSFFQFSVPVLAVQLSASHPQNPTHDRFINNKTPYLTPLFHLTANCMKSHEKPACSEDASYIEMLFRWLQIRSSLNTFYL